MTLRCSECGGEVKKINNKLKCTKCGREKAIQETKTVDMSDTAKLSVIME